MNIDEQKGNDGKISFDQSFIECATFCQQLFDNICTCHQHNRNSNAYDNENEQEDQKIKFYPHMRKLYNDDTDSLEYVYIIMSTIKPKISMNKQQEGHTEQRYHHQHGRLSKQRAKVLITEYCKKKIDNIKIHTSKRNYL